MHRKEKGTSLNSFRFLLRIVWWQDDVYHTVIMLYLTQYDRENQTHGPVIFLTPIFFFKIYFGYLRTLGIDLSWTPIPPKGGPGGPQNPPNPPKEPKWQDTPRPPSIPFSGFSTPSPHAWPKQGYKTVFGDISSKKAQNRVVKFGAFSFFLKSQKWAEKSQKCACH